MNIKNINWRDVARIVGFILLFGMVANALEYWGQKYFYYASPLIPDWVMSQAAKPYLVGTIVFAIASICAWTGYYFAKYKLVVGIGALAVIFQYINLNIVGESWNF